ncbi:Uma2 family endonuclease [Planctomicrobium sp. SH664]|uniref:Uma2 family endonuclease n=1 Tax=Planctomicrobium sp. SH664 TaxID=3448125 RepID=UPI003F5BC905
MIQRSMTAREFSEQRADLPDAGQWSELIRGVPVSLQPPDLDHGTIVLNLSKAFAGYVQSTLNGYPCFDLGLWVERQPDSIFFPAASYFLEGSRFAEADKEYTETVPALIVELLTTGDRRRNISERLSVYIKHGTRVVWLIDPQQQSVHVVIPREGKNQRLSAEDTLSGDPVLSGFSMPVAQLFAEPSWAR